MNLILKSKKLFCSKKSILHTKNTTNKNIKEAIQWQGRKIGKYYELLLREKLSEHNNQILFQKRMVWSVKLC